MDKPEGPITVDEGADAILSMMESEVDNPDETLEEEKESVETDKEETSEDAVEEEKEETKEEAPKEDDSEVDTTAELPTSLEEVAQALDMETDAFFENFKTSIKIDGEESEVSLNELRSGYQRHADYTRKTQEVAEQRKAFEAEREVQNKEIMQRVQQAQVLIDQLETQFTKDIDSVDWNQLRLEDPAEHAAQRQEALEKRQGLETMKVQANEEVVKVQQEQQKAYEANMKEYEAKEADLLLSAIPSWKDESVAKTEQAELTSYLRDSGFSNDEIGGIVDHRAILLARKAMLADKGNQKSDAAKKKVVKLPKFQKPGVVKEKHEVAAEQRKQKLTKMKKSGSIKDAAEVFLDYV